MDVSSLITKVKKIYSFDSGSLQFLQRVQCVNLYLEPKRGLIQTGIHLRKVDLSGFNLVLLRPRRGGPVSTLLPGRDVIHKTLVFSSPSVKKGTRSSENDRVLAPF